MLTCTHHRCYLHATFWMTHTLIPISRNHKTETTSSVYSVLNNTKCLSCQSALSFPQSGDGVKGDFLRTPPAISKEQMDVEGLFLRMLNGQCASRDPHFTSYHGDNCAAQDVNLSSCCQVSNYFIRNTARQIIHMLISTVIYNVLVVIFDCEKIKNVVTLHLS